MGGGLGGGWGFAVPEQWSGSVQNPYVAPPIGNGRGVEGGRQGFIAGYTGGKGLPGMSGGRRNAKVRRSRKARKARKGCRRNTRRRVQAGGRYGFDGGAAGLAGGAPWASGIAPTMRLPCEASYSAIPAGGASGTLNAVGSPLWDGPVPRAGQMGGAYSQAPLTGAASIGADAGSPSLTEQTAGYTHLRGPADTFPTAAGTIAMVNAPAGGRFMNPACLTTGGGRSRSRSRSRSRKNRSRSRR